MGIREIVKVSKSVSVCVVLLERDWCSLYSGKVTVHGEIKELNNLDKWTPTQYIKPDAIRLFEEIVRRIKVTKKKYDTVIVSMPGTIKNYNEVFTSSRLGIKKAFQASNFISERLDNIRVGIIHDIDCMLFGACNVLANAEIIQHETICYIVADEGVGSALMIDGKIHRGAGVAGHISRLVLEENGIFFPELAQAGSLESYVSRPWISKHCVERYEASRAFTSGLKQARETEFEKALATAFSTNRQWDIPCDILASGIHDKNQTALECFKDSAKYLGKAINSIITICHPHRILLAGELVTEIDGFYNETIESARKLSWATAWNAVSFDKRNDLRDDQVRGSFILSMIENWRDVL